jgi:hypothetical protein
MSRGISNSARKSTVILAPARVICVGGNQGCHITPGLSFNNFNTGQHAQFPGDSTTALRTDLAFGLHSEASQSHRHGTETRERLLNYVDADEYRHPDKARMDKVGEEHGQQHHDTHEGFDTAFYRHDFLLVLACKSKSSTRQDIKPIVFLYN